MGICNVDGCKNYETYWACTNCSKGACKEHQAFAESVVTFCGHCFKDYLKKRGIKSIEEFDKKIKRKYLHIGKKLYEMVMKYYNGGGLHEKKK